MAMALQWAAQVSYSLLPKLPFPIFPSTWSPMRPMQILNLCENCTLKQEWEFPCRKQTGISFLTVSLSVILAASSPNSAEAISSLLQISNSSIQVENLSVIRSCDQLLQNYLFEVGSADGPGAINPTALPYSADIQKSTGCSDPEVGLKTDKDAYTEVTDESIVEDAWQIVNEVFLDARANSWSPEDWQKQREDIFRRPIRSRMAAYSTIRSMLSTLNDPFTRFLTPDEFLRMSKYDITGVGLNIGEVSEETGTVLLKVLGVILQSPAQIAGIKEGDEILSVDGNDVAGKNAFEVASLIQGLKGTPVSIKIRHRACGSPQALTLLRQQDIRSPVYYRLERIPNNEGLNGYIRIKEFNALAKRDLVTAMNRLSDAGATSFTLDLRDNLGGLVQAGIETAKVFLEDGETVVYTARRNLESLKNVVATGLPLTRSPVMVLINEKTASASEIVAAALHDNCRAVLVGRHTFGKGLIQSVYELGDGSGIVLTVGKYVTPHHQDIDRNGIKPDFTHFPDVEEAREKLQLCRTTSSNMH